MSGFHFRQIQPIPREELTDFLEKTANESKEIFGQKLDHIQKLILRFTPEQIVSTLSFYTLVNGSNHVDNEDEIPPVLPAYVEFIQALILSQNPKKFQYDPILSKNLSDLAETITILFLSEMKMMYADIVSKAKPKDQNLVFFQSYIRNRTKIERDCAYPFQTNRIATELIDRMDSEFRRAFDLGKDQILSCFDYIQNTIESRITKHIRSLMPIIEAKSVEETLKAHNRFLKIPGPIMDLEPEFRKKGISSSSRKLEIAKGMVLSHTDLMLYHLFEFTKKEVIDNCVEGEKIWPFLIKLSNEVGALHGEKIDHFFMANPVLLKPFIKTNEETILIPCHWILTNNRLEIMESIIQGNEALQRHYLDKGIKGSFLEDEVFKLFKDHFPKASFFRGSIVKNGNVVITENDLLIILDQTAIVIESKSLKFSEPARRGSQSRMQKDLENILSKASEQIELFCQHLLDSRGGRLKLSTKNKGTFNEFDTTKIRHWIKLIVTFDPLGNLVTKQPSLASSGLIKGQREYVPLIAFTDLEIVFDVLKLNAQKIHYLLMRNSLELHQDYFADELDLLILYTNTGFNLSRDTHSFFYFNLSSSLHEYYSHNALIGPKGKRPTIKITNWWGRIIETIENRATFGWAIMTTYLLTVAYKGQQDIESNTKSLIVQTKFASKKCSYGVYDSILRDSDFTILVFVYNDFTVQERDDTINRILEDLYLEKKVDEFIVLGFDTDSIKPYDLVAYFSFKKEQ